MEKKKKSCFANTNIRGSGRHGALQVLEEAHEQAPGNVLEKETEETEQEHRRGETPPPKRARPDSAASPVAGKKTKKQAKPDPFYREKREFAALQAQRAAEQAVRCCFAAPAREIAPDGALNPAWHGGGDRNESGCCKSRRPAGRPTSRSVPRRVPS